MFFASLYLHYKNESKRLLDRKGYKTRLPSLLYIYEMKKKIN